MSNRVYYWTTADGKKIDVDHLEVSHMRNILKQIIRNNEFLELQQLKAKKNKFFELHGDIAQMSIDQYDECDEGSWDPEFYKY